eukprot:2990081-Prymnesium_polylepis.1
MLTTSTLSTKDGAPATHLRRARAKHQRAVHTAARAVRWRPIVLLNAFFDALEFLKASWIGARPPLGGSPALVPDGGARPPFDSEKGGLYYAVLAS